MRFSDAGKPSAWGLAAAAFVAAAAVSAAVSLAWVPFRSGHSNVIVALVLVVVMTAAGASGRRPAVLGATASAAFAFTIFDTQPYDQLSIAKESDVLTAVALVVVGLLTGELALRMARNRRDEASASSFLGRVRDAATLLAEGEELAVFIDAVARELAAVAGADECVFSAEALCEGMPVVARSGHLELPAAGPPQQFALPVWALGEVVGHFVLRSSAPKSVPASTSSLQVAVTLADQVGAALAAQAPLPPLPPAPGRGGNEMAAPVPRLRVVPPGGAMPAASDSEASDAAAADPTAPTSAGFGRAAAL